MIFRLEEPFFITQNFINNIVSSKQKYKRKQREKQTNKRKTTQDYAKSKQEDQSQIKEYNAEATEEAEPSNNICSFQVNHMRQNGAALFLQIESPT